DLRPAAAAELARDQSRYEDARGPGEGGEKANRRQRVAEGSPRQPQERDRQRRLVDVAEREVVGAGDVVELVAKDAVAVAGGEVEDELRPGDEREQSQIRVHRAGRRRRSRPGG